MSITVNQTIVVTSCLPLENRKSRSEKEDCPLDTNRFHWKCIISICERLRKILIMLYEGVKSAPTMSVRGNFVSTILASPTLKCLNFWFNLKTRLRFFHWNRCVSMGSDGLHWMTFLPSLRLNCLYFRFYLTTRILVTPGDSTRGSTERSFDSPQG